MLSGAAFVFCNISATWQLAYNGDKAPSPLDLEPIALSELQLGDRGANLPMLHRSLNLLVRRFDNTEITI